MSKEKKEVKVVSSGELFESDLKKKYGEVMRSADFILKGDEKVFSVSPNFDSALGGVPEGSWVTFSGPSGCGKTTIGLEIAGVMQKENREVFFMDAEHRLKKMNLEGVKGLDAEKVRVIRSTKERQLAAEDFLQIGTDILKSYPGCILIIDSASSLCPMSEMVNDVSGNIRTTSPKTLGNFCRKNSGVVRTNGNIVFIVKHIITNTSGYGEKWLEDGGEKVKFQADIRVTTKGKPENWVENGESVGHVVEWDIYKSATGASGGSFKTYLRYGEGIDRVMEIVQLAQDYGIIEKSGSWFKLDEFKVQGEAGMRQYLNENASVFEKLKVTINEIQGI